MNNKLLITVQVPSIEQSYDLFIPINKKVGTIKKYVIKAVYELADNMLNLDVNYSFFDIDTGVKYMNNVYVKDSGMKNGARIMLI